jgi:DNA repair ATPase RecN
MENGNLTETELLVARLAAENEILKQLLQEEQQVIAIKNIQQRELETKAAESVELKSHFDLQAQELKATRSYVNELMQRAEAAIQKENELEKQVTQSVTAGYQLEEIKTTYNHLTAQLNDLTERLQHMNTLYTMQSQYAGRIAELESMLANAEEEIEKLKTVSVDNNAS